MEHQTGENANGDLWESWRSGTWCAVVQQQPNRQGWELYLIPDGYSRKMERLRTGDYGECVRTAKTLAVALQHVAEQGWDIPADDDGFRMAEAMVDGP